jgi:hypothetical protein
LLYSAPSQTSCSYNGSWTAYGDCEHARWRTSSQSVLATEHSPSVCTTRRVRSTASACKPVPCMATSTCTPAAPPGPAATTTPDATPVREPVITSWCYSTIR